VVSFVWFFLDFLAFNSRPMFLELVRLFGSNLIESPVVGVVYWPQRVALGLLLVSRRVLLVVRLGAVCYRLGLGLFFRKFFPSGFGGHLFLSAV